MVFGIKASKDGGHPTVIVGISNNKICKEKIENLMLSNIVPRLDVKIKTIAMQNTENSILLVQIPDSYNKPHYNQKNNKFYKRYNFQSNEMTEQEIADSYRRRFSSHDQVEQYVNRLFRKEEEHNVATGHIVVIPSNIEHRLIDTFDNKKYEWMNEIQLEYRRGLDPDIDKLIPTSLHHFAHGLYSEIKKIQRTEIHRNGCIYYVHLFRNGISSLSLPRIWAVRIIHTLQTAFQIMSHYNYLGDVKIVVKMICPSKTPIILSDSEPSNTIEHLDIQIERMFSLQHIETNYEEITADIMHEIMNHFGTKRCNLFDEDGRWIK